MSLVSETADMLHAHPADQPLVMVVEDSRTQAMLLKHLLERNGYRVIVAISGREALDLLAQNKPSLIISDIVMPKMDGYELTQRIKEDEKLAGIPVILLTALSDPDDVIRGLEAKVDFYLTKPYDEDFLLNKIGLVISNPAGRPKGELQKLEVNLWGTPHQVKVDPEHSLSLLASTYENAVQLNAKLRKTQSDLQILNRDLEKKVDERTAHLKAEVAQRKEAEEKVLQRTAELEAANNELREFAYVVSHDLKAPLRGVSQLAAWLAADQADNLDDDGKEMIDLLLTRLDRMHNLIEGILQYSRIGRVKEEETEVDLNELVAEIIDLLAPPDNVTVSVENTMPVLRLERTRIGQVFQNLLSNAIKFLDKPEGLVKVTCEENETHWRFGVTDNGPGIDPKYHEKIFQIFQTLTARDELESTGIGLTVVKKIIDMAGGRITVESELGVGTAFFFTLPKRNDGT